MSYYEKLNVCCETTDVTISSGPYITRDAFHYGPLVLWIITNWKQYRWGQRVEIGLLYYFPFACGQRRSKSPPIHIVIYLYTAHHNNNNIPTTLYCTIADMICPRNIAADIIILGWSVYNQTLRFVPRG